MSQPNIPNISPNISVTRDEAINLVIASVAMEELGLSHIINSEGEKIQYVLGTIPGISSPNATINDILAVDKSVNEILNTIMKKEIFLDSKLDSAIDFIIQEGSAGLQAFGNIFQIGTQTVPSGSDILFSNNGPLRNITHAPGAAPIIVGLTGTYNIAFVINTQGGNIEDWAIFVNGVSRAEFNAAGQSITSVITLDLNAGDSVTLRNVATAPPPAVLRIANTISATIILYKIDS